MPSHAFPFDDTAGVRRPQRPASLPWNEPTDLEENGRLDGRLCDVPLPAGFMSRMRALLLQAQLDDALQGVPLPGGHNKRVRHAAGSWPWGDSSNRVTLIP